MLHVVPLAGAVRSWYGFSAERRWPSGTIPSTAQRTARLLVLGFELADYSLGLVVEGSEDLVGVLFRAVKSQAADREIDGDCQKFCALSRFIND